MAFDDSTKHSDFSDEDFLSDPDERDNNEFDSFSGSDADSPDDFVYSDEHDDIFDEEFNGENDDNDESSEEISSGPNWLRVLAIILVAFVGVGCFGLAWYFFFNHTPVPAELPQGDFLFSSPSPPQNASTQPPAPQPPGSQPSAPPAGGALPQQTPKPPAVGQPPVSGQPSAKQQTPDAAKPDAKPAQQGGVTPTAKLPAQPAPSPQIVADNSPPGAWGQNPFIDLSTLRTMNNQMIPRINASGNRSLPSIPQPDVLPEILPAPVEIRTPPSPGPAPAPAGPPPTVGGIITKSGSGETIAIMGDGTVLSEGDTYNGDKRVTFIGGDGITFDDGNSVPFNSSQTPQKQDKQSNSRNRRNR